MDRWGTYPEWVAAISTALAFAGAGWLLTIELRRDKRLQDAAIRTQADQIAAWVEAEERDRYGVHLKNASELPISNVEVQLLDHGNFTTMVETEASLGPRENRWYPVPNAALMSARPKLTVMLSFTDNQHYSWIRFEGTLVVKGEPPFLKLTTYHVKRRAIKRWIKALFRRG